MPSPTMRDVLAMLFRQRRLALISFVLILSGVLLYGFTSPAYRAHMKLLLRRERVDPVVSPDARGPAQLTRAEVTEADLNSEIELLLDESLLRKVVLANDLQANSLLSFVGIGDNDDAHRLARGVRNIGRRLRAEPLRKSNMIVVSYDASDPIQAGRVLNTLANVYVEKHAEVHRLSGQARFFEQQTDQAKGQLSEAELRVVELARNEGIVSAALERDLALQHVSDLDVSYRQVHVARAENQRRIQALQSILISLPPRTTTTIRSSDNPQLLQALKARLLDLELRRSDLLKTYEPNYRLVQEVEEQIALAKTAITAEIQAPLRDETTEKDPNYEWAESELQKARVEQTALAARTEAMGSELTQSRQLVRRLGQDAIRQQDLLRSMRLSEDSYLLYARKSEEARIEDALDERGILNVTVAEPPVAPVLPKRSGWMVVCLALLSATVTSVGLSVAADYLDPAFRTPGEVVACLKVPLLASLPRETS